jgi:dipeptide/tripeptide permease
VAATGLAYVPLVMTAVRSSEGSLVGLGWLLGCLALLSVGELLVGALGPSLVLRLAPTARRGRWLGAWYGATALGFWLAGRIGGWWDRVPHALFFVGMAVLALSGMVICAQLRQVRGRSRAQAQTASHFRFHPRGHRVHVFAPAVERGQKRRATLTSQRGISLR